MRSVLADDRGKALYKQRAQLVEPIFGDTKHNRGFTRFARRGRAAVRTEWRLLAATHNLLKLHQHFAAAARATKARPRTPLELNITDRRTAVARGYATASRESASPSAAASGVAVALLRHPA